MRSAATPRRSRRSCNWTNPGAVLANMVGLISPCLGGVSTVMQQTSLPIAIPTLDEKENGSRSTGEIASVITYLLSSHQHFPIGVPVPSHQQETLPHRASVNSPWIDRR